MTGMDRPKGTHMTTDTATRPHPYDDGRCDVCGHPASHHDGGECWTDPQGAEIWDDATLGVSACNCGGYEPAATS